MVDESVYQFQSFCQYRAKMKNKTEEDQSFLSVHMDRIKLVLQLEGVINYMDRIKLEWKIFVCSPLY